MQFLQNKCVLRKSQGFLQEKQHPLHLPLAVKMVELNLPIVITPPSVALLIILNPLQKN